MLQPASGEPTFPHGHQRMALSAALQKAGNGSELQGRMRTQRAWAVTGVTKEKRNPIDNDKAQRDFRHIFSSIYLGF